MERGIIRARLPWRVVPMSLCAATCPRRDAVCANKLAIADAAPPTTNLIAPGANNLAIADAAPPTANLIAPGANNLAIDDAAPPSTNLIAPGANNLATTPRLPT